MMKSLIFATILSQVWAGRKVDDRISLGGGTRQVTWYIPDDTPTGWVYLQHGFSRNKRNVDHYATTLMDEGALVLTVQLSVTGGAPDLARAVGADIAAGNVETPEGVTLPSKLVVSGHSAGGLFATVLAATLTEEGFDGLAGEVLLDPVDGNGQMEEAFDTANVPVRAIMAAPGSCNSNNNAVPALKSINGFSGFRIVGGAHTDAEGDSSDFLGRLFCGTPDDDDVAILQTFASAYTFDLFSGTTTSEFYPGGDAFEALVDSGDIELY